MRRTPLALAVVVALTLAACGGDDDDDAASNTAVDTVSSTVPDSVTDVSLVPATTVPVSVPAVSIPAAIPTELVVTTLTPGEGPEAAEGDTVYVNYVGVRSADGQEFDSNYGGSPFPVTLGQGGVIQGWEQGLVGATAGERRQLDIPSDLAYGDQPQGDVIQAGDALTFVIDVLAVLPPSDPADEPTDLPTSAELVTEPSFEDLRVGTGATLEAGQTGLFHFVFARGDDGTVLQSTWADGQPQPLTIPEGEAADGIGELVGMQVGGRRAVTIPPSPDSGLTPETNVLVIADLLAVLS